MDFDDELHYKKDGLVRRIVLNRATKHNAVNVSMQKQLHEAIRAVRFDEEARALIISGAGNTFCAGDDSAEMPILNTANSLSVQRQRSPNRRAIRSGAPISS